MHPGRTVRNRGALARALPLAAAGAMAACGAFQTVPLPAPVRLSAEVSQILNTDGPTPDFYRDRSRLETMGAELDQVLVDLVNDGSASETVRANAEILLADRRSPLAESVLRRALLGSGNETVRTGAVLGLQRLAPESEAARNAIRAAIGDPSPQVRLNVIQALDVEDAPLLRSLLAEEDDPQVTIIARQLLGLLEARGAPLQRDRTGDYRTTGSDSTPRIVFHPTRVDTLAGVASGALWVEVPGRTLVPLAQEVEAVGGVVPAFFDPHGERVVFETHREVQIRDLRDGTTRVVGPGVAPRPIPFTDRFVFLREAPVPRVETPRGTLITYDVLRVPFADARAETLGRLRALARPDLYGNASAVRRVEVGEVRDGFVLRGEGIEAPFLLPNPFEGAQRPAAPAVAPRPACSDTAGKRPRSGRRFPLGRRRPPPPPPCQ
jgi:hypothetical protein